MKREKINAKYKWTIDEMYPTESDFRGDVEKVKKLIKNLSNQKGSLAESKENLYQALHTEEMTSQILEKLTVYTHMKCHEDTRINENQEIANEIDNLYTEFEIADSYVDSEILNMDSKLLDSYLQDEKLSHWKFYIEKIMRDKPYKLTQKEEELLSATSDFSKAGKDTFEMLAYADMKFPKIKDELGESIQLSEANYGRFLRSKDRNIRENAFKSLFDTYENYKNTFASTLYNNIKSEIFHSKMRHFKNILEFELHDENITTDVYENLISSVNKNIPILDKYIELKKEYLGLDEMHMYDLYTPLANFDMNISYENAQVIILEALKPMGEEYLSHIKDAFKNGWIDVYANDGKKSGAYSWGCYDSNPYILMNYQNDLNSVFTLIHELGHSMHSFYSKNTQSYLYSNYEIFVAEVASTVNEQLLIQYLLKNAKSKEEKIYLLNYYLEQFRTTVYRQTMFAEFEKITHEMVEKGKGLTAEKFKKIYMDLNKKYYGNTCVIDEEIGMEWARIPHFYSNFYVYKYATGFSAASVLSKKIIEEGEIAVERYKTFLKSGGSDYPLNQLKNTGVNMEKKESIEQSLSVFVNLVDELGKEINK